MHVEHVFHDLPIGCVDMDTVCNWGLCCAASQSFGLVFSLFYFVWGSKAAAGAHLVSVVVRRLVAGWPTSFLFLLRHHCWPALYVRTISNGVSRYVHASVCESTRNEIQRHLGRALGHRWFIGQRKKNVIIERRQHFSGEHLSNVQHKRKRQSSRQQMYLLL